MRKTLAVPALLSALVLGAACGRDPEPRPQGEPPQGVETSSGSTDIAASCAEVYSPEALVTRSFAFDGTVTSIEPRSDPKLPTGQQESSWVTFDVNDWFLGGSGATVGIWMDQLNVETSAGTISAELGTRLLVSGEPRWGGDPLDDPLAWTCGFTQQWTEDAAEEWSTATA
jgi:hypothetical protein